MLCVDDVGIARTGVDNSLMREGGCSGVDAVLTEPRALVSVVVPTRNRHKLMPRAVRSALAQTYRELEVIIVDDASEDCTPDVIAELRREHPRVRGIRNAGALGGAVSRNAGLRVARGRYTAFLDDDDEWHPRKIERQLPFVEHYSFVGCSSEVSEGFVVLGFRVRTGNREQGAAAGGATARVLVRSLEDIYCGRAHASPTVFLARTEHLRAIGGFDESLVGSHGYDLCVRMARRFGPAAMLEETLARHHQEHGLDRISDSPAHREGGWQTFEKHAAEMPRAGRRWRRCLLSLRECREARGLWPRAKWFIRALLNVNPLWPVRYAQLFVRILFFGPLREEPNEAQK